MKAVGEECTRGMPKTYADPEWRMSVDAHFVVRKICRFKNLLDVGSEVLWTSTQNSEVF